MTGLTDLLSDERLARLDAALDARLVGLTVLLEDVRQPQNMGACIRTVEALGLQDVHVIEGEIPFEPNRAITQGCEKWVDLHRHPDPATAVARLRAGGFRVLATSPDASATLEELDFGVPSVLCFGNERYGITPALFELADTTFRIPMAGFTRSFNLSVSVGITMHWATRARRAALGRAGDLGGEAKAALRTRWVKLAVREAEAIEAELRRRG